MDLDNSVSTKGRKEVFCRAPCLIADSLESCVTVEGAQWSIEQALAKRVALF